MQRAGDRAVGGHALHHHRAQARPAAAARLRAHRPSDPRLVYELASGGTIANGDRPGMLSSEEVRGCENKQFLKDLTDVKLMGFNGAKIVKEQKHG